MSSSSYCLGLLRIGSYEFAVPAATVQHVVLRPALTPLPDPGRLATGSFRFRGNVVPAMDIATIFNGQTHAAEARQMLAVLRQGDHLLGLEVDGFRKVANLSDRDLSTFLAQADGELTSMPLFPRHFWDEEIGATVGVMDTEVLLRTEGIRSTRVEALAATEASNTEAAFLHLALFQVSGRTFGIDVDYVRQALYAEKITPAEHCGSLLYGHFIEKSQHIPVIRLLELLKLPAIGGEERPQRGLVIGAPAGEGACLWPDAGFLIENVAATIKVPETAIHPLGGSGIGRSHFYRGVLSSSEHDNVVVLDGEAVLREIASGRRVQRVGVQDEKATSAAEQAMYIVYRVGRSSLATALSEVEAVIPAKGIFPMGGAGDAFAGLMPWREHRVNLLDPAVLLGRDVEAGSVPSEVLVVKAGGLYYGFLVSQVESMVSASPRPSPAAGRAEATGTMIEFRVGTSRQNVPVLELRELVRRVSEGGQ